MPFVFFYFSLTALRWGLVSSKINSSTGSKDEENSCISIRMNGEKGFLLAKVRGGNTWLSPPLPFLPLGFDLRVGAQVWTKRNPTFLNKGSGKGGLCGMKGMEGIHAFFSHLFAPVLALVSCCSYGRQLELQEKPRISGRKARKRGPCKTESIRWISKRAVEGDPLILCINPHKFCSHSWIKHPQERHKAV